GIGLAIARALIATRHRVILTSRESSLARFDSHGVHESERVRIRPLDVTNAEQRQAVISEAEREWGGIDVLINNAGVSYRAVVEHIAERDLLAQMDVNFRSPMELIRLVLPHMRQKRAGRIITISSVGGMMAMPTMGAYSASKFALEGAHEALWYEVRPWGIGVSLVQPGFVDSDGFQRVRFTPQSNHSEQELAEPYHEHYVNMGPFIEKLMQASRATPESVARVVVRTMHRRRPPLRIPATNDAWGFSLLRRLLPRSTYHWLLYRMLPKVGAWGPSAERIGSLPPASRDYRD
ncbi:MAG: SDR family NAD(P)-dependent oxidoreductase, partial [Myxococcales bacterium]